MFLTKSLTVIWATDTMGGRVNSLDRNHYTQVFSNGTYFSEIYLTAKKSDVRQALKTFLVDIDVPEELTVDGSTEQNSPGTEFTNTNFFLYYFLYLIFSPYPL